MLNILLTTMLLILPFLTLHNCQRQKGLYTGLWLSLFFLGKLHPLFSILTFIIALGVYVSHKRTVLPSADGFLICRPMTRFMVFLSVMMIFCALGGAVSSYGQALHLSPVILQTANVCAIAASIAGPVFYGILSDKAGPFPTSMVHLFLSASGVFFTIISDEFPYSFLFGQILVSLSISGVFLLIPVWTLYFIGFSQFSHRLPALVFSLISLWTMFFLFCSHALVEPEHAVTILESMFLLLLLALPFAIIAWKERLILIQ